MVRNICKEFIQLTALVVLKFQALTVISIICMLLTVMSFICYYIIIVMYLSLVTFLYLMALYAPKSRELYLVYIIMYRQVL